MFKQLFDASLQNEMVDFLLNDLAKLGILRKYKKGTLLDPMDANHIYVVVEGRVAQRVYCEDGQELTAWWLKPGTMFGEMDFFDGEKTILTNQVTKDSLLSVVPRAAIEKLLIENPESYKFFIHSIVRKHRIIMLRYTTLRFNDVRGRIADKLLRIAYMRSEGESVNGLVVGSNTTHENFAKQIGVSRSTFTSIIKEFEREGYLKKSRKSFTILNEEALNALVKRIW